jgi:hypothetical protein
VTNESWPLGNDLSCSCFSGVSALNTWKPAADSKSVLEVEVVAQPVARASSVIALRTLNGLNNWFIVFLFSLFVRFALCAGAARRADRYLGFLEQSELHGKARLLCIHSLQRASDPGVGVSMDAKV